MCPLCASDRRSQILSLKSEDIVAANWSYRPDKLPLMALNVPSSFEIVRCNDCAFVYAACLPPEEFLSFVYDELIDLSAARRESYCPRNLANRMEYLSILLRMIDKGGKILDYGCGFGSTLGLLRNIHGIEAVGFDTSSARVNDANGDYLYITSSVSDLRDRGPFDAVILDNVLEHVPEPRETMEMVGDLCAEGAILYISVPDASEQFLDVQIALNRQSKLLAMDVNPWEHLNYFDLSHLDSLMKGAGFVALKQADLASEIRIGLRPERQSIPRIKNTFASLIRALRYAVGGDTTPTVNRRYYRFKADAAD